MSEKKLGFGFMRLPVSGEGPEAPVDGERLNAMVDAFLARGFTYFDTAWMYHAFKSEIALRESLVRRHPRDSFAVATKLPTMFLKEEGDQERIFAEQLEKCGVDYFDYYLLHNLNVSHYEIAERFSCFAFGLKLKAEGKIRRLGFSFHDTADLLDRILTEHPQVDFVQLQINYVDWESESIQSRKCLEVARRHGKPVIVMEPVKGGTLAKIPGKAESLLKEAAPDASVPSWAIRFAASQEGVFMVLSGMSTMEQLNDNTGFMADFKPLSEAEAKTVTRVTEIIRESVAVPCTACRYCVDGCPKNIAIPEYFSLYNEERRAKPKGFSIQKAYYNNFAKTRGKASECIECGQCETACPQRLPIMRHLKEAAAALEA